MRTDPAMTAAVRIVERLRAEGHTAYVAGGAVRDILDVGAIPRGVALASDGGPTKRAMPTVNAIDRKRRHEGDMAGSVEFAEGTV